MRPVCMFLAVVIVPTTMAGEPGPQLNLLATLEGGRPPVLANIAFSPDGKAFASSDYNDDDNVSAVKLWDVGKRKVAATFGGPLYRVSSVAFGPDGKTLVSAGSKRVIGPRDRPEDDPVLRLWELIPSRKVDE